MIASLDTEANCGKFDVIFYSNGTSLDANIFQDNRSPSSSNHNFVLEQTQDKTYVGLHIITYKVFLEDYPAVEANSNDSF